MATEKFEFDEYSCSMIDLSANQFKETLCTREAFRRKNIANHRHIPQAVLDPSKEVVKLWESFAK